MKKETRIPGQTLPTSLTFWHWTISSLAHLCMQTVPILVNDCEYLACTGSDSIRSNSQFFLLLVLVYIKYMYIPHWLSGALSVLQNAHHILYKTPFALLRTFSLLMLYTLYFYLTCWKSLQCFGWLSDGEGYPREILYKANDTVFVSRWLCNDSNALGTKIDSNAEIRNRTGKQRQNVFVCARSYFVLSNACTWEF